MRPPAEEPDAIDPNAIVTPETQPQLKRVLGLFDVTMIVMGCIIGAGVFFTPAPSPCSFRSFEVSQESESLRLKTRRLKRR